MALSLGQGMIGLGQGMGEVAGVIQQRRRQAALEGLLSNIMQEPAAAPGQAAQPDAFSGFRSMVKGMNPKDLAAIMGSEAFSPAGLKALTSIKGGSASGALVTGEQLQKLFPNLAGQDLKGHVFQQKEDGSWSSLVGPKRPIIAGPGQVVLDADTMQRMAKVPERLQIANISPGGQLRLVDPETGTSAILAERAPAPTGGGGGGGTPNVVLQVPGVGPDGEPIANFYEYARGKGGAPGQMVQQIGIGTKSGPKPLPDKDQQDFIQAAQGARALNDLEKALPKTGRLKGLLSKGQAFLGTDPAAIQFETSRDQLKLAAQALIKGIPSNFDVETVIDTLPALTQPASVNKSRIDFTRKSYKDMVQAKIGFYKGLNYQLPPDVFRLAQELGVDPDTIQPLTQEQMLARTKQINQQIAKGAQKLGGAAPAVPGTPAAKTPVTGGAGPSIDDLIKKYGGQ